MITVVGGTGRLGRLVAARLTADGQAVRVVGRSAPASPVAGAEFREADVRTSSTLPGALAGSEVVVSAVHGMDPRAGGSPAAVDRDGNRALIAAARAVGARVVLVSVIGASPDHPLELFRMKAAAEAALRSGAPGGAPDWTIVRASGFAEMWLDVFRSTGGRSGVPKVLGAGRNPVNVVSVDDVAVAVARAATDPALIGSVIEVAGEDLSLTELAALVTPPGRQPAHLPSALVSAVSTVLRPVRPGLSRVMRQTLEMERLPLGADAGPGHQAHPWLPLTPITHRSPPVRT
ncbi:MAG: NAD(P)H-binding protein [Lapillicoccus sp.]